MKYSLNNNNFNNFEVITWNTLKPRSYFINFSNEEELKDVDLLKERYSSSLVHCLNGEWNFKFYNNPNKIPAVFDTDEIEFDKVPVPSVFQYTGYSNPSYVNTRYMFPFKPPYVPTTNRVKKVFTMFQLGQIPYIAHPKDTWNFVGIYQRKFDVKLNTKKKYVITFLGVASCLDLYINGQYAGYAEGTHNMHEFDITSLLVDGSNEIVVAVHRWCNGSYIEAQDMFRNNGIFRDVLLKEEQLLKEYQVKTKKDGNLYNLELEVELYAEGEVQAEIVVDGKTIKNELGNKDGKYCAFFRGLKVEEWNAEKPTLYPLFIKTFDNEGKLVEVTRKYVGFRTIEIKRDKLLFNDRLIKIRGVNHHDTSPDTGYYMSPELIDKDMRLVKEINANAVRTSHYPPDPLLIELANKYGIYIVDEADCETHGVISNTLWFWDFNILSRNLKWKRHYLDRIEHLYERDKNNVSILMWSLGNEAGGYQNQDLMYAWLKERTDIPVHYESVIHSKRKAYDIGSEMYAPISQVELVGDHKALVPELNDRPYFLCEYAHAMGVGPGALEEYVESFYKFDNVIGGCIWEMIDHSVREKDGTFTYGGDHGEYMHDGNFCCDGLFYPDRRYSTGAHIAKFAYRPLIMKYMGDNKFTLFNALSFTDANEFTITFKGSIDEERVIDCKPLRTTEFVLDFDNKKETIIDVEVKDKKGNIYPEQFVINYNVPTKEFEEAPAKMNDFKLEFKGGYVTVENNNLVIDYKGTRLCSGEYGAILYRAPTDNDTDPMAKSEERPYTNQTSEIISVNMTDGVLEIDRKIKAAKCEFLHNQVIKVGSKGLIEVVNSLKCVKGSGHLFRFANDWIMDKKYTDVHYYARKGESYCDMKNQTPIGEYSAKVIEMTEPNIRPQESGNRYEAKWLEVSNGSKGVKFTANAKPFEIGVKPYTDKELLSMRHTCDEVNTCTNILINMFNMGIGTGSCGPKTLDKYSYSVNEEYTYSYFIEPLKK